MQHDAINLRYLRLLADYQLLPKHQRIQGKTRSGVPLVPYLPATESHTLVAWTPQHIYIVKQVGRLINSQAPSCWSLKQSMILAGCIWNHLPFHQFGWYLSNYHGVNQHRHRLGNSWWPKEDDLHAVGFRDLWWLTAWRRTKVRTFWGGDPWNHHRR